MTFLSKKRKLACARCAAALVLHGLAVGCVRDAFAQDGEAPAVGSTTPQDVEAAPDEEGAISSKVPALARLKAALKKGSESLAGTARLGGWYHFGKYGAGLATSAVDDTDSTASHSLYRGDFGLYGILDQMIYRVAADDPKKGVGIFARVAGSPSDRNLIDFYVDAGINFAGVMPSRPEDVFGFAVDYSHVSPAAAAADVQAVVQTGVAMPVRTGEIGFECTYQAQVIPGFVVQPDVQYIIRPSGGEVDSLDPPAKIRNAAVSGVRVTAKF